MALNTHSIFISLCLLAIVASQAGATVFTRKFFPDDFIFGVGSSAYQYEGAAYEDGKGPSVWDASVAAQPDKIDDGSNGIVAEDFYHRYKEDVKMLKEIGVDSFRFSIAWTRILPRGTISGGINPLGVKFYNNLINLLLANGIKPFVTIMHYDQPQALIEEYGGFLSSKIVDHYRDYADLVFKLFGDRVKYWVTFNEPNAMGYYGYAAGHHAPFRCSNYVGNCTAGNSATEPYIVAHNLLLAHAAAVKVYKQKYQAKQKGIIGITIATHWFIPLNSSTSSVKAASRMLDFLFGWFVEPVTFGEYPKSIRSIAGNRLPRFTKEQSESLKHSIDFLGVNYYTAMYVSDDPTPLNPLQLSYTTDWQVILTQTRNGVAIGDATGLSWLYVYPQGISDLVLHIKKAYDNPPVIITENGYAESTNNSIPIQEAIQDRARLNYHYKHISYLLRAMKDGANVIGYYAWTFLDDFEWDSGYTLRFGMVYVDWKNGLKRYKKRSAVWYQRFLKGF